MSFGVESLSEEEPTKCGVRLALWEPSVGGEGRGAMAIDVHLKGGARE
jgi:hypothetical protein